MYQEASLQGIFKIIFWFFVISFLIRLIGRMLLPYLVRKGEQNLRDRMSKMQEQQKPLRPEGHVTIETNKGTNSNSNGDYVDYVEIKD